MYKKLNAGNIHSYLNDSVIYSFLKDNLDKLSGDVLDIGCGKKQYKEVVESGSGVKKYIGLDLEEGKFTYSVDADIFWDGIKMPLEDNSIDSAIIFEVIEHCPDPSIIVSEIFRVLKPGGVLLFSIPFLYHLHGIPYDYQRLTPFGAKELFEKKGFSFVETKPGGLWDASLGQMISIWIVHRPMPSVVRKILRKIHVPFFKLLLKLDKNHYDGKIEDNMMISSILGLAQK